MANILKQSTAVDVLIGPFVDTTDGATAITTGTIDVELSKNGQALANKNDVTAPTHDAAGTIDGYWNCELDATDTNTVGNLVLVAYVSTALHVRHEFQVVEEAVYDNFYAAAAAGPLTAAQVNTQVDTALSDIGLDHLVSASVTGTDITNNSIIAKIVSASATADWDDFVNTTDSLQAVRDHIGDGTNLTEAGGTGDHLTNIGTIATCTNLTNLPTIPQNWITANGINADAITAAKIATDAIGSDELAAGAVTKIWAQICETQGSRTAQQILSIALAVLAGETTNGGATFLTPETGGATRVTATLNGSNERTAITLAPSS